jgi:hypothetical protein
MVSVEKVVFVRSDATMGEVGDMLEKRQYRRGRTP